MDARGNRLKALTISSELQMFMRSDGQAGYSGTLRPDEVAAQVARWQMEHESGPKLAFSEEWLEAFEVFEAAHCEPEWVRQCRDTMQALNTRSGAYTDEIIEDIIERLKRTKATYRSAWSKAVWTK